MSLRYRQCPKCGHADARTEVWLEEQCPACGVQFRKLLAARSGLPARGTAASARDQAGSAGAGVVAWMGTLIEPPAEGRESRAAAGAVLLLLATWYTWRFIRFDVADFANIPLPFLHGAMVPFHEFGHILFRPFGEFLHLAGGSLVQFLMPLGFGIYFVHWRRDNLAGWLMLWWEGTQWVDLAPYCYDAKQPVMILLTGRTGETGAHDYIDMLGDLGLLNRAHEVAALMKYFGVLLMLVALAWGAMLLARTWQDRAAGG